jgi:hypothetical protein
MWKLWGTRWIRSHVHYVNYLDPVFINLLVIFVSWKFVFKWRNVINFQKRQAEGKRRLVIIIIYVRNVTCVAICEITFAVLMYQIQAPYFNCSCNNMLSYSSQITDLSSFSGRSQHYRSAKPLLNKKFYLDLKNHITSTNLEQKLKSLGAVSISSLFILVLFCVLYRNTYHSSIRGKVDVLSCNTVVI